MKREKGLTLIELLISLMIIVVLSMIAVPKLQDRSLRAYRVGVRNILLEATQKLHMVYTVHKQYLATTCDGSDPKKCPAPENILDKYQLTKSPRSGDTRYKIELFITDAGQGYLLTATAVGKQTKDRCLEFTLDSRGIRGGTFPEECWR